MSWLFAFKKDHVDFTLMNFIIDTVSKWNDL